MVDIIALVNLLGSFASIVSLYRSVGADKAKAHIETEGENIYFGDIHETTRLSATIEAEVEKFKVIDDDISNALYNRIIKAKHRFTEALNDPRSRPANLNEEEDIATLEICEALKALKRLNQDRLPDMKNLNEIWLSFRCKGSS